MKKHSDYVTHIDNKEDIIYLKSKLFPVNMRLFKTSKEYKKIILDQCDYLANLVLTKMDGYKKPHGMSSANAGLSFNIIAICENRNLWNEDAKIMINPKILKEFGELEECLTNCGSLTLNKPIKIKRYPNITIEYYNLRGDYCKDNYTRNNGSLTIQHEIDHNLGILITDRIYENYKKI